MDERDLGIELMELYRRLRQAADPAVKAVIRRRIDSLLAGDPRGKCGRLGALHDGDPLESGAD